MRRIGTLNNEQDARRFADYLFSLDIKTRVDESGDAWEVWGLDEDRISDARTELEQFQSDPNARKYVAAGREAEQKREAQLQQVIQQRKRQVNLRDRWDRPLWLQVPITIGLIAASLATTLFCEFGDNEELTSQVQIQQSVRTDVKPNGTGWVRYSRTFLEDVRRGEIWRLVTPIFLHLSPWHLFGNMYWMALFGGMIERRQGNWGLIWKVLLIAVVSNVAQYAQDGPLFGGMSGVGFGLFGYVWIKGQFDPDDGLGVPRETAIFFLIWMLLCSTGLIGPIANVAHSVGLLGGMLLASPAAIRRWLD